MADILNFPKFNPNLTAIDQLREVLRYAESRPEEVQHVMIIFNNSTCTRQVVCDKSLTITEALGMLDLTKHDLMRKM
jgi:hypothetical protein